MRAMNLRNDVLALQEADSEIDRLRHRSERLSERADKAEAEAALARLRHDLATAETDVRQAEVELQAIEDATTDIARHRARLEAQMKTIIAPREAEALQHEMATLDARRSDLDDRGLELLDALESATLKIDTARAAEPQALATVEAAAAALAEAESKVNDEVRAIEPVRAAAAGALDGATLSRYDTMRRQYDGVAVARLQGSQCTGCHLDLSVGEADELRRTPDDQLPECPSCGRMLVP
jgi:uncharacterized protein